MTYRSAGVDIEAGEEAVRLIKREVESTYIPGVLGSLGGFAGLFQLPTDLEEPVLVTGTDGVGTKILLAQETGRLDTVGIDLVAMSVNDVLTIGARPILFLDYIAVGRLEPAEMAQMVAGVAEGCRQAGCALVGGEMAEMPGVYDPGEFDMAGFCVGLGERNKLIDGSSIAEGDAVLGLKSNGLHSNGFSLVRKVLEESGLGLGGKL
ncbi:MAG: phosphoribosylformylglycinamidine cyclo-ligase, partial [Actinobacteria bacterium]|nr:phosphoribosylformylglycinamidine cyclo-ligase [Actinomycetota bacterium]